MSKKHEHHVWCKYMDNPHGNSWKNNVSRIILTEEQHKKLHQEIILPILNKYARSLKKYKHEEYIWKNFIDAIDKERVIDEVVVDTIKWKEEEDAKTINTTTK